MSQQGGVKARCLLVLMGLLVTVGVRAETVLTVTATAYNSLPGQGAGTDHSLAAWGDTLEPGMRVIAVSRDLIRRGLTHNTPVTIEGLPGIWLVKDKMHRRWKNKIDIYMGHDRQAAREWGRRRVKIRFSPSSVP
ncbi:hypothetical protein A11A3_00090 [Alcanivorax hongdengensis A-11-3]|uniref:3D domain-containing protein n=1 Tax=Alcanivorax hongdengensis A-11-3 TaxID=1177179 RepID=L0WFP4_9GAMM|nr:3D domain-containing protein [Alcanivorax hongdengensis]EKF75846.1 hypothetical protein A11A3_00090 [Alcanivorax hongdengensis A-11-3]